MPFLFPKIDGLDNQSIEAQVAKVNQELREVIMATSRLERGIEIMDVIHSAETLLRLEGWLEDDVPDLVSIVTLRNRLRGYYGVDA